MAIIADLFFRVGLSDAKLRADLERARGNVKQTAKEIKTSLRKETGEARDAVELLGRSIGVQLPASVRRFVASSSTIRPLLAGLFNVGIVTAFAGAVIAFIPQIRQMAEEFGGLTQQTKDWYAQLVKANDALLLLSKTGTRELLADVNQKITELSGPQQGSFLMRALLGRGIADFRANTAATAELNKLEERRAFLLGHLNELDAQAAKGLREKAAALREAAAAVDPLVQRNEVLAGSLSKLTDFFQKVREQSRQFLREQAIRNNEPPVIPGGVGVPGLPAELPEFLRELERLPAINIALKQTNLLWEEMKFHLQGISQAGLAGIGDALLGLQSWKNLARQVLADLGRMLWYLLVVQPLMKALFGGGSSGGGGGGGGGGFFSNLFGGLFGGIGQVSGTPPFVPTRQFGGPVMAGRLYETHGLGKREFFRPDVSGAIVPGKAAGVVVNQNNDLRGADLGTAARLAQALDELAIGGAFMAMRDVQERTA